jgi:DNA-binding NarL/FixJ family response regulator
MEQTPAGRIRILVADDHPQVREQLAARLRRESDFVVVGVTANSVQTLQEAQVRHPELLLMDPIMRDGLGLATLRQVRASFPELVIVVLTAFVDTALNMHFQQMGIRHVLTKGIESPQLLAALRMAYGSVGASLTDEQEP